MNDCYVYVMKDKSTGYFKIGLSKVTKIRENTLQSEKPVVILIAKRDFKTREKAKSIEDEFHRLYSHFRVRGEYFNLGIDELDEVLQFMASEDKFPIKKGDRYSIIRDENQKLKNLIETYESKLIGLSSAKTINVDKHIVWQSVKLHASMTSSKALTGVVFANYFSMKYTQYFTPPQTIEQAESFEIWYWLSLAMIGLNLFISVLQIMKYFSMIKRLSNGDIATIQHQIKQLDSSLSSGLIKKGTKDFERGTEALNYYKSMLAKLN